MKCKKCNSENLAIVKSGPGQKLVCVDCLAYQKFLSKSEAKIFMQLQELKNAKGFYDGPTSGTPNGR